MWLGPWTPTASGGVHLGLGEERTLALGVGQGRLNLSPLLPEPSLKRGTESAQPRLAQNSVGNLCILTLQKDEAGAGESPLPPKGRRWRKEKRAQDEGVRFPEEGMAGLLGPVAPSRVAGSHRTLSLGLPMTNTSLREFWELLHSGSEGRRIRTPMPVLTTSGFRPQVSPALSTPKPHQGRLRQELGGRDVKVMCI